MACEPAQCSSWPVHAGPSARLTADPSTDGLRVQNGSAYKGAEPARARIHLESLRASRMRPVHQVLELALPRREHGAVGQPPETRHTSPMCCKALGKRDHYGLRPANTMSDMDIRASDKLPGAKVRLRRRPQPASHQMPVPREWLARADGVVQEVRTDGPSLTVIGQPLPYQPGRAERRSGVPDEVITSEHVPNLCTCSWAYSQGKLTLKHYNAACPVHLAVPGR